MTCSANLHRRFSPHHPNPFPQKSLSFHPQHCPPRQTRVSPFGCFPQNLFGPVWRRTPQPGPATAWTASSQRSTSHFSHIHNDIVGPLQPSNGFTHLFSIIDRTSSWMEAVPLVQTTAAACAKILVSHWVSRFGVPQTLTSDRGLQFTSNVWFELCRILNIRHRQTTAYHPEANGLVERLHRRLKDALKARTAAANWSEEIHWVLLGLRAQPR